VYRDEGCYGQDAKAHNEPFTMATLRIGLRDAKQEKTDTEHDSQSPNSLITKSNKVETSVSEGKRSSETSGCQ